MDDNEIHNELAARERMADLPISKLLVSRLEAAADANSEVANDPVTAALVGAIVSLEELIRKG